MASLEPTHCLAGRCRRCPRPQKPLPFLPESCRLEYCLNPGSQGACKATGCKFEKDEVRFVCTAGSDKRKIYLSVAAAGDELAPVLQHVGHRAFSPTQVGGLEDLAAEDRRRFCQVGAWGGRRADGGSAAGVDMWTVQQRVSREAIA